jgi:hypothetical protein
MERYLVDSFRLQTVLRLIDHELCPSLNRNTQQSWWYSTGRLTSTDPYRRIITVLRKVRYSFKNASENVDCTEEELSDAVDVLWQVLHHPDKPMEVRDPQETSRAEFEMRFQELQEKYKAEAAKKRSRRRSGKSKPTTLEQLQAVDAASREGLLRVVCEKRIALDGEQVFLKLLDEAVWRVERATQGQLESNLGVDDRHRGHMESHVLPRPDRMQLFLGLEQNLRRAIKEDWQLFQEALQQEARVCSQDIEVQEPENVISVRAAVINRDVQLQFEALVDQAIHREVLAEKGKVQRFASLPIVKARLEALHGMLCPPMRRRPGTTIMEHDPKQDTEEANAKRVENFLRVMRETSLPLEQGPAKDSPAETSETGQNDESGAESAQASETGGECPSSP